VARRVAKAKAENAGCFAALAWTKILPGGGMCANGKFVFDADGNLWSGQNWMPGSQSGVSVNIGGGLIKVLPTGTVVSPGDQRIQRDGP